MTLLHIPLLYPDAYPGRSPLPLSCQFKPSNTLGLGLGTSRPSLTFSGVRVHRPPCDWPRAPDTLETLDAQVPNPYPPASKHQ